MDKLKLHSPDITAQNIEKVGGLFPNCVTETRNSDGEVKQAIDFDQLRQELSTSIVEGTQERYQLNWPGKREALLTANAPIAKTLRPCREESVDFDTTRNLFIEGDNLDALKLLQETYLNRVKMIYIDPPYNTGNDFLYDDDFNEDSNTFFVRSNQNDEVGNRLVTNSDSQGRFHSDWMSMIMPRLKLARNLLSDNGVIFISIDDKEVSNLRKLCDEVFGGQNFLGLVPVINNMKGRNDKEFQAQTHEYIIVFQKKKFVSYGLQLSPEKRNEYDQTGLDGRKFQWRDLRKRGGADTRRERPNLFYPIFIDPETGRVSLKKDDARYIEAFPRKSDGEDGRWRWEKKTLRQRIKDVSGRPVRGKDTWNISYRVYLDSENFGERREKPKSVWIGPQFSTDAGTKILNALLSGVNAKDIAPKAVGHIARLVELSARSNDIVMDFFSGSATTAHSVMEANADDGGLRKYIMVQMPEPCDEDSPAYKAGFDSIAEIGKERIRRAGKKIKEDNAEIQYIENLDIGFRVLKIDTSNMNDVYYTPDAVKQDDLFQQADNIRPDRTPEDLLFQVMLDWGVDLTLPIARETIAGNTVFHVDENALSACFDEGIDEAFVKELATRQPLRAVFRDSGFANDSVKINVEQIFKHLSPHTDIKVI